MFGCEVEERDDSLFMPLVMILHLHVLHNMIILYNLFILEISREEWFITSKNQCWIIIVENLIMHGTLIGYWTRRIKSVIWLVDHQSLMALVFGLTLPQQGLVLIFYRVDEIRTKFELNSCAFFGHFSAREVNFVHIYTCDHGIENCPQGLPLKFQGASFGAIKFFWGKIFIGSLTGSGPEIKIIIYSSYVFRPNVTYMACCWGSVVTEISVAWVMALKCQKKVRASSRKKAQLNSLTKKRNLTA